MRIISVVGENISDRVGVIEELVSLLSQRGVKVGVAVHRISGKDSDQENPARRYARAGASQVLVTKGKELSCNQRIAGLTPIKRIAARYFNTLDILFGDGYLDPGERIQLAFSPNNYRFSPDIIAVVGEGLDSIKVPNFVLGNLKGLADLLASNSTLMTKERK